MARKGARLRGAVCRARARYAKTKAGWRRQRRALAWRRRVTAERLRFYRHNRMDSALKSYRRSRNLVAKSRAEAIRRGELTQKERKAVLRWEGLLRAFRKAIRRPWPHLSGDLDCDRRVLDKLERLARHLGRNLHVTSGRRSFAEQLRLWNARHSNPFPVAEPCKSNHCDGDAADVLVGGVPIQFVVPLDTIRQFGLMPLIGDEVHVEG